MRVVSGSQHGSQGRSWVGFCHSSFLPQGQFSYFGAVRRKAQLSSITQDEHTHINHLSGPGWVPWEQWTKGNLCPPSLLEDSWSFLGTQANLNCCPAQSPLSTLALTGTQQTKSASEVISVHSNNTDLTYTSIRVSANESEDSFDSFSKIWLTLLGYGKKQFADLTPSGSELLNLSVVLFNNSHVMRPQFLCGPWALEQSTGRKQKAQRELKESKGS